MKRKLLFQFSAVAIAVIAVAMVLVACGGGAGFSSQEALAKEYMKYDAKMNRTETFMLRMAGDVNMAGDDSKFYYDSKFSSGTLMEKAMKEIYDNMSKEMKEFHKAMMDGKVVESYKADGSVDKYVDNTDYKKAYKDAQDALKSVKFVSAEKDNTATASLAGTSGYDIATNYEAWTLKYEITPYTDGVAQTTAETVTVPLELVKISGKWYINGSSASIA